MAKITEMILQELKEIKDKQSEHTAELRVYNVQLTDHIARTELLEERMEPVEDHVKFINKTVKVLLGLLTAAGSVIAVISYLHK